MLIISQNLLNYDLEYPKDVVIRFNLAWVDDLDSLNVYLPKIDNDVFIDLPIGRTKPPNNSYELNDLKEIVRKNKNVRYIAISNVETHADIENFIEVFPEHITIIPKIESKRGVENISEICKGLISEKIIMLDHDDMFSDFIKNKVPLSKYLYFIEKLDNFCKQNSVRLLKTRGVIFSDEDKYKF